MLYPSKCFLNQPVKVLPQISGNEFERFAVFSTIRLKDKEISLLESFWKSLLS